MGLARFMRSMKTKSRKKPKVYVSEAMKFAGGWALDSAQDELLGHLSPEFLGELAAVAYVAMARQLQDEKNRVYILGGSGKMAENQNRIANADEVEITDEMIAAANEEIERHYLGDGLYDLTPPTLEAVYRAMRGAEPK